MRKRGKLAQWDDAKGYGFIAPDDGGPKLFVHISAFGPRAERPWSGETLTFERGSDAHGKPRALNVRGLRPEPPTSKANSSGADSASLWLVPGFAAFYLGIDFFWPMPPAAWGAYMAMSLATFIVYLGDKRAARLQRPRVAERTLHLLALACGWPGALLARQLLRHKSAKPAFGRLFWLTVGLNVLGFTLVFTPLIRPLHG